MSQHRTCLIARHHIQREHWRKDLSLPGTPERLRAHSNPHFFVVAPGDMPNAYHFDEVLVPSEVQDLIETCARHAAWFETCIAARLLPGAEIVVVPNT